MSRRRYLEWKKRLIRQIQQQRLDLAEHKSLWLEDRTHRPRLANGVWPAPLSGARFQRHGAVRYPPPQQDDPLVAPRVRCLERYPPV